MTLSLKYMHVPYILKLGMFSYVVGLTLFYVSSNILSVFTKRHCDLLRFISVKSRSTEKESPSSPDELVLE